MASKQASKTLVEDFLLDLHRRNYSPLTIRVYGQVYSDLVGFASGKFESLTSADLRRFLTSRGEIAAATRSRYIAAMRSLARFMAQRGQACPFTKAAEGLQAPRMPLQLPRSPTEEQAALLLSAASRPRNTMPSWQVARLRAAVLLLYGVGLRAAEMLSLPYETGDTDELRVVGKGQKERLVFLLPVVKQAVQNYKALWAANEKQSPFLFGGWSDRDLRRAFEMLRQESGLPKTITPHALRHGFATHIYQNGGDIRTLADFMGHTSVRTTARYMQADASHLLRVVQSCMPGKYGKQEVLADEGIASNE
jgi:integrase/recombinase XerC